jgi:hypothetical protein
MFVEPAEVARWSGASGLRVDHLQGEALDWSATVRRWTVVLKRGPGHAVTYSALLRKPVLAE